MIKLMCASLAAAACLASAAETADLSMTPIYKSRLSAIAELDGRLNGEYRTFNFIDRPPANATAGTGAKLHWPMDDSATRAGMDGRF
jgi:hypothetical protein